MTTMNRDEVLAKVAAIRAKGLHVDTLEGVLCGPCAESLCVDSPESFVGPWTAATSCYNCTEDMGRACLCHEETQ
jgi:hypothetical protein